MITVVKATWAATACVVAVGLGLPVPALAETAVAPVRTVGAAPAPSSAAPIPVRVVSTAATGPIACANAVWPNVPPECLKGKDGAAATAKPVRVVGAQDDLRTNPEVASDLGKAPKKLKRLPRQN
ncbi:MAG: hypothetical protein ACRCTD_08375 [Beijerinckiaceae bacterium]